MLYYIVLSYISISYLVIFFFSLACSRCSVFRPISLSFLPSSSPKAWVHVFLHPISHRTRPNQVTTIVRNLNNWLHSQVFLRVTLGHTSKADFLQQKTQSMSFKFGFPYIFPLQTWIKKTLYWPMGELLRTLFLDLVIMRLKNDLCLEWQNYSFKSFLHFQE